MDKKLFSFGKITRNTLSASNAAQQACVYYVYVYKQISLAILRPDTEAIGDRKSAKGVCHELRVCWSTSIQRS